MPTPDLVEHLERIVLDDAVLEVVGQEAAGVVAGQAPGGLGEVVGAEGEELRLARDLVGGERRARQLDHGAEQIGHRDLPLAEDLLGDLRAR